jgi:hypothetical protein
LIENQNEMNTKSSNVTQHMHTADWIKGTDYLPLKLLLAKQLLDKKSDLALSKRAIIELAKRVTLGLSAFTFTSDRSGLWPGDRQAEKKKRDHTSMPSGQFFYGIVHRHKVTEKHTHDSMPGLPLAPSDHTHFLH